VCRVSPSAVLCVGGVLATLVLLSLFRAVIASGSADYPYDE